MLLRFVSSLAMLCSKLCTRGRNEISEGQFLDFFNGAIVTACGHSSAQYGSEVPCISCEQSADVWRLRCRSEIAAAVAVCLDGLKWGERVLRVFWPEEVLQSLTKAEDSEGMSEPNGFWSRYRGRHSRWASAKAQPWSVRPTDLLGASTSCASSTSSASSSSSFDAACPSSWEIRRNLGLGLPGASSAAEDTDLLESNTIEAELRRKRSCWRSWYDYGSRFIRSVGQKRPNPNLYEILDVPEAASELDIRRGYLKKCRELHPDKRVRLESNASAAYTTSDTPSQRAGVRPLQQLMNAQWDYHLQRVMNSYKTLSCRAARRAYDTRLLLRETASGPLWNQPRALGFIIKHVLRGSKYLKRVQIVSHASQIAIQQEMLPQVCGNMCIDVFSCLELPGRILHILIAGKLEPLEEAVEALEGFIAGFEAAEAALKPGLPRTEHAQRQPC
eukprot:TRINITY_DN19141_c0_g2_i3.p1 TRINITY_DN19141_c0_g2~~TRINITY_DN19141_c0_g2_i3.p1  ORF type:complete len:445 (-),score=29.75 TRINITY_DN19141_c0_g2_i3:475-1809(-)